MRPDDLSARVRKLTDAELLALERSKHTAGEEWKAVTGEIVRRRISAPSAPVQAASARPPTGPFVCRQCGHVGHAPFVRPGTGIITFALSLLALVPALYALGALALGPITGAIALAFLLPAILPAVLYSLWRSTHAYHACPVCMSRSVIPATSPVGRQQLGR